MGLALATNLKFYTSVEKGLKLKIRKFWGLIPTFVEVTREKLVGGPFWPLPPILNRVKNFPRFAGKHLSQSLIFNKVAGLSPALDERRDTDIGVFL